MITGYLQSLSAELRAPRRARTRILAEVGDHLHEAVAAGQTEREAVEAFGDPHELAARFHEQLASTSARRASVWTGLLVAAFVVGVVFAPVGGFVSGIVTWVGAQLAVVAAALGLTRWLRYRPEGIVPANRLADLYRANGLVVACVGLVGVAQLADGHLVAGAAMLVGSAAATIAVGRSIARARLLPAAAQAEEDALDDLHALLVLAEQRAPRLSSAVRRAGRGAVGARWFDLRNSPWRFCLFFAAVCGVGLAAQHAVVDGGVSNIGRGLLAGLIIASIEAAAVVACFAAFGRFLGIRR